MWQTLESKLSSMGVDEYISVAGKRDLAMTGVAKVRRRGCPRLAHGEDLDDDGWAY